MSNNVRKKTQNQETKDHPAGRCAPGAGLGTHTYTPTAMDIIGWASVGGHAARPRPVPPAASSSSTHFR